MITTTFQAISHYFSASSVCNWQLHLQSNASGRYFRPDWTAVAYRQRNARTPPDLSPSNSHRDRWTYKLHRQTYTFNRTYRELYKSPVAWRASGFLWCDKPQLLGFSDLCKLDGSVFTSNQVMLLLSNGQPRFFYPGSAQLLNDCVSSHLRMLNLEVVWTVIYLTFMSKLNKDAVLWHSYSYNS